MSRHNFCQYQKNIAISSQRGAALLEALLALGIFASLAATGIAVLSLTLTSDQMSYDRVRATQLATEGLEAAQQIQHSDWNALSVGTHGLSWSGYGWNLSGANDQQGKFQRAVAVAIAQRDGSGNISNTGTPDPDTKKLTSTVSWPATPLRTESVSFITYLTHYFATIPASIGNWALPLRHAGVNLSGTHDAYHMAISGNYLYVTRASTLPNFMVLDITNPLAPTVVGQVTTNLLGTPQQIAVWGSYAYVASTDNTQEIQIINVSNPSNPTLLNYYNTPGNNDMFSLEVKDNTLFAGRNASFLIFSLATPSPGTGTNHGMTLLSTTVLTGAVNDLQITDNTLCFATSNTAAELMCSNVTNLNSPTTPLQLNLTGTAVGASLDRIGNTLFVGLSTNNVTAVSVANFHTSLTQLSQYSTGGAVRSVAKIPNSNYLLALTSNATKELQVINISNPSSMTEHGFLNTASTPVQYNTILYHAPADVAYGTFPADTEEITIFKPTPL